MRRSMVSSGGSYKWPYGGSINVTRDSKIVYLEFDVQKTDRYGRLLAYVWLDQTKTKMMNEILVRKGYATVYTFPPNVKYQERFLKAQREAREEAEGGFNCFYTMVKIFLQHLWLKWRELEGLPISKPYSIERLGHAEYISAEEFVPVSITRG